MNINFILPAWFKSGGVRIICEYANKFFEKGHNVTLFYPQKIYNFYPDKFKPVYNIKRIIKYLIYTKKERSELFDCKFNIKEVPMISDKYISNADITIATAWPTSYSVANLNESKGKKVYLIQGYEVWDSSVKTVINSYSLPLSKITVSKFLHDYLISKYNIESKIILNSIDFNKFNNHKKIYNQKTIISFIINGNKQKNPDDAIWAINKIYEEFPDIDVICFGLNKYKQLPGFIRFVENPSESKIISIYKKSDIFLFSSLFEGFGLPPAEAMACKCAVVSNNVGGVSEFSSHMISAIHCNPSNREELYFGLKYLLNNKEDIKRISENGYLEVRNKLDWDKSFFEFEKYLLGLIET
jgi:glycosyltransferase involved in cell wall biosynthesis